MSAEHVMDSWADFFRSDDSDRALVTVRIGGESFVCGPIDAHRAEDIVPQIHRIPSTSVSDATVQAVDESAAFDGGERL